MKRKILKFMAMFLVLIMSISLLSACGGTKTSNEVESTEENLLTDDVVINIDESIYGKQSIIL